MAMKRSGMFALMLLLLPACIAGQGSVTAGGWSTLARLPNASQPKATGASAGPQVLNSPIVEVQLGSTSATSMFIHLSSITAPAGKVTFLITNTDTMEHELVGFATKTPAGAYPITSFEGEANRIDEDAAGTAVVDTGASLPAGTSQLLTVDLKAGHVALVCNLAGHYAAGMHADFWVY